MEPPFRSQHLCCSPTSFLLFGQGSHGRSVLSCLAAIVSAAGTIDSIAGAYKPKGPAHGTKSKLSSRGLTPHQAFHAFVGGLACQGSEPHRDILLLTGITGKIYTGTLLKDRAQFRCAGRIHFRGNGQISIPARNWLNAARPVSGPPSGHQNPLCSLRSTSKTWWL